MSKKTDMWEKYRDVEDKIDSIAIIIGRDRQDDSFEEVGSIIGRFIKSRAYGHTVEVAMKWLVPDRSGLICSYGYAGGCGYNKIAHAIGCLFDRETVKKIEETYNVKFKKYKYDNVVGDYTELEHIHWSNYAKEMLEEAGFRVIVAVGRMR